MSALFSASAASMDIVLQHAAFYGLAAFLFGYLGKRLIGLWIDSMGRQSMMDQHAADALQLASKAPAFDPPEIAPEDEPTWDGKAPLTLVPYHFALHEPTVVLGGDPAQFDVTGFAPAIGTISNTPAETAAETSGRHALTESMPVLVDDERALAVVASVAGGDGAT